MKKGLIFILIVAVWIAIFLFFAVIPYKIDADMNAVRPHPEHNVSAHGQVLHQSLRVADLHADTLLWKRNPNRRHSFGQTDLPRLRDGGVALQVFSAVTYVPGGQNEGSNKKQKDQLTSLMIANGWPPSTWFSIRGRALFQAKRLRKAAHHSDGDLLIAKSGAEITTALRARETNQNIIVGVLALEGAHALEGELANIDVLYDAGYRMMGLHHFFDNELGGSLHGAKKGGLTPFGRVAVLAAIRKGMVIDLAHSSKAVVRDVLEMTDEPVVVSHTGLLGACNHPQRNLPDELMAKIAARGGLIGIGYWKMAVCDNSPAGIAKTIAYGVKTFGADAIALGSDFDGSIKASLDTSELAAITDALLTAGLSEGDIRKVMGENLIGFLQKHLP